MLMLTKISLGKKISPGTNTLAYFGAASVAKKNGFNVATAVGSSDYNLKIWVKA